MYKVVIFGGTTEGRLLCEYCKDENIPVLYCVATEEGAQPVQSLKNTDVHIKRLDAIEMTELLRANSPSLVIDATHPYAEIVSRNIKEACENTNVRLIRVARDTEKTQDYVNFPDIGSLVSWLKDTPGVIFSTLGVSAAGAFVELPDYQTRVWMRILPAKTSLLTCLELGYRADRLICMQGPFSEDLNRAMFQYAGAEILVTKESGETGGFAEKIRAAQVLGMKTAILRKPEGTGGIPIEEVFDWIRGAKI